MTVQELFEKGFRPGDEFYKYCADCGKCATTNIDSCPACLVTLMRASEASEHDGVLVGNLTEGLFEVITSSKELNFRANDSERGFIGEDGRKREGWYVPWCPECNGKKACDTCEKFYEEGIKLINSGRAHDLSREEIDNILDHYGFSKKKIERVLAYYTKNDELVSEKYINILL